MPYRIYPSIGVWILGMVLGPGRQFAVAERSQFPGSVLASIQISEKSSQSICARSMIRHRTTPWAAGIGPLLIASTRAARWVAFR